MNKFLALAAMCGAAYLLYDFQSVKQLANETLRDGKFTGVEACVAYSESDLVSAQTTRNACSERFQKRLFDGDFATGRAGPKTRSGSVYLEGSLENKLSNHVTTWVELSFYIFDLDGKESKFYTDTYVWIEPRASYEFSVALPDISAEDVRDLEFCDHDDESPKSCMSWGVRGIKGVEL